MNGYILNKSIVGFTNILILIFCFFDFIADMNIFQIVRSLHRSEFFITILLALPFFTFVSLVLVFLDKIKGALIINSTFFVFMFISALYLMIMVDQVAMIFNFFGLGIYSVFVCFLISIIFSVYAIRALKMKKIEDELETDVEKSTVDDEAAIL